MIVCRVPAAARSVGLGDGWRPTDPMPRLTRKPELPDTPQEKPAKSRRNSEDDVHNTSEALTASEIADELDLSEEERDLLQDGDQALLNELNDPSTTPLGPPPSLGRNTQSAGNLFGRDAVAHGRASTPKLWSQAAQFPTCVQLRVWRWENGIPAGLGVIDAEATEEDFVHQFYEAMPRKGQGRFQFKIRPIDIRGQEMGQESTINISEHHATLQAVRRARQAEAEENARMQNAPTPPISSGGDDLSASMASEMSRMFERAVEAADSRTHSLEQALQEERDRLRLEDERRAQERIDMASSAAAGVQAITERMMKDESSRAERALQAESQRSQLLLTTLTQIFASAQQQQSQMGEAARAADARRLDQERQYAERVRIEQEERRKRDIQEMEQRRKAEQDRLEDERKQLRLAREFEAKQVELRIKAESEEMQRRLEREKAEQAAKIAIEEKRLERERMENEARLRQRKEDEDRRLELEKQEIDRRSQRERLEWEHRWKLEAEERDRRDRIDREEREKRAALELERRKAESDERERRDRIDREERDRRTAAEREAADLRRQELERRARMEEEASKAREQERQRQHELQLKQLESIATRDREHAERMTSLQMTALQAQRDQAEARARQERDEATLREQERQRQHERLLKEAELKVQQEREQAEARAKREHEETMMREQERLRQHERLIKEAELKAQQDREHAERMMQLTQQQYQTRAFGGLGELLPKAKELLSSVGIEPTDILQRILAPEAPAGASGSSWADAIPKVLSSLAEIGKVAVDASRPPPGAAAPMQPQRPAVQMPTLPGMMPMGAFPPGAVQVPGAPPGYMAVALPPGTTFPGVPAPQVAAPAAVPTPVPAPVQAATQNDVTSVAGSTPTRALPEPGIPATLDFGEAASPEALLAEGEETGSVAEPAVQEEAPPDTTELAKNAGLTPSTIKTSRKAIRTLVRKLQGTKPDTWFGVIASALQAEMSIYHYVKAVTVREALIEGGATEDLTNRVIDAMKESSLIPPDVNYE